MAVALLVLDALLFLTLLGFLGLVLYAAFGRDERDNMRGGCKRAP